MKNVINSKNKQDAYDSAVMFLRYYPFRYAYIIDMGFDKWGWFNGKTKAKGNRLTKLGCKVYLLNKA